MYEINKYPFEVRGVVTPVVLHSRNYEITPKDILQHLTPYIIQNIDAMMDEKMETLNGLIEQIGDVNQLKEEINQLNEKLSYLELEQELEPTVIYIEQMSRDDAKEKIRTYFNDNEDEDVYPSDLSEKLHIDYQLVWDIIKELKEEEFIETGD